MKKIFQANGPKQSEAILISDKADFTPKLVPRDKECHFILIKETIHQETIILNIYVQNDSACNYIKKKNTTEFKSTDGLQHSNSGRLTLNDS
jgi:hypothetical protein